MSNEEKDYDKYIKEQLSLMETFLDAVRKAHKEKVANEWLLAFFDDYGRITEKGFKEAIAFANKEWDIG